MCAHVLVLKYRTGLCINPLPLKHLVVFTPVAKKQPILSEGS